MAASNSAITPELLLRAYAAGVFPMSDGGARDEIFWVDPERRGILPLDGVHISRSLARTLRREPFQIRINTAFEQVVAACADRSETWINPEISELYHQLHRAGFAHSVEVLDDQTLVGGLYGVALGGAFFGESMFSRKRDTSKIALAYLVARLRVGHFQLLDTQFVTDHLISLGAIEIPRASYQQRLAQAIEISADFYRQPLSGLTGSGIMQCITQTS